MPTYANVSTHDMAEDDLCGQMATHWYYWVAILKNWLAIYVSVGSISIGVCTCIVKVTINGSSMYVNVTI